MKLYNSLSMKKEDFVPIDRNEVKMYSCGPTVYNYFHIGNARPFIIFDMLRRYLIYKGYNVRFVQNFTDIDDKMIKKANELNISVSQLAEKYIQEYFIDAHGLGITDADVHPKATENIEAIISIIKTLEDKGFAYNVDGDVYFSTLKFNEYGKLSHQVLEDLEAGSRIDISEMKKDAADFALWKKRKEECEPAWESPWGMGRPGWHIECSAMANKYLGETIDIHSGGKDLMFPHHENEIAQSEAANNKPFANYWVHNGYINIDNKKMSKSAGNFFTVRDIADKYGYEALRFFMLSSHYRSPVSFSMELIESAKSALERIHNCTTNLEFLMSAGITDSKDTSVYDSDVLNSICIYRSSFEDAMDDDLNTADAISVIFDIVSDANKYASDVDIRSSAGMGAYLDIIKELAGLMGILRKSKAEIPKEVNELLELRAQARKDKDWSRSDALRNELKDMGYTVEDTAEGQKVNSTISFCIK